MDEYVKFKHDGDAGEVSLYYFPNGSPTHTMYADLYPVHVTWDDGPGYTIYSGKDCLSSEYLVRTL